MAVDIVVVAVHPDDELLAAGGTLLRHRKQGDRIHWVIVTSMTEELGFSAQRRETRKREIAQVATEVGFHSVTEMGFPTTQLSTIPDTVLVDAFSQVFQKLRPNTVYLPFHSDVHSDHRVVFQAAYACTKTFRYPFIRRVLMMETVSETEFSLPSSATVFLPNVYVDVTEYLEEKIRLVSIFQSEISVAPFPRSPETLRALAAFRGSVGGSKFAEAFMLLKEVQ